MVREKRLHQNVNVKDINRNPPHQRTAPQGRRNKAAIGEDDGGFGIIRYIQCTAAKPERNRYGDKEQESQNESGTRRIFKAVIE